MLAAVLAVVCLFAAPAMSLPPEPDDPAQVELRCKIVSSPKDRGYKLWRVELKKSSGVPVRHVIGASGDTVKFKNLQAGIYVLCLSGEHGRSRCQSVDLVPPAGQSYHRVEKKFEVPPPLVNQKDAHKVRASRLAIPAKAKREMIRSEAAQISGDHEQALRYLERAVELHPQYADALNNLGTHYHRMGNYDKSIGYFTRATKSDPDMFAGWVNLAGSLMMTGKMNLALTANKRAVELRPDDPLANSQTGMNYFYLRNYSEAKRHLEKALQTDPSSANSPQLFLAHIAYMENRREDAGDYIRGYLELHPNSPQAPRLRQTLENISSGSRATIGEITARDQ